MTGINKVPRNKPVLFLPNHQNALIDPLLIAAFSNRKPYFLTRSDVFSNSFFKWFFGMLQMIPIYRFRDGRDTLDRNVDIFEDCANLLIQKEALLIFPEGNHDLKRRVRPLSKGFTRILFKTLEMKPELDISLIPVGVNYTNAVGFPDSTAFYFGREIRLLDLYKEEELRASASRIKESVTKCLKELTTHIEDEEGYDVMIAHLDSLQADYLKPKNVNDLLQQRITPDSATHSKKRSSSLYLLWDAFFQFLNLPAIIIWRVFIKRKVPEAEFISTHRLLYGLLLFPVFYLAFLVVLKVLFGTGIALALVAGHFVFNLLYVKLR